MNKSVSPNARCKIIATSRIVVEKSKFFQQSLLISLIWELILRYDRQILLKEKWIDWKEAKFEDKDWPVPS
jgi:hypothetical protein